MDNFTFKVNRQKFESINSIITGKQILEKSDLLPVEDYELLIKVNEKGFEPVQLDEEIDLNGAGIEGFYAKPYKKLAIYVDDELVEVEECFMTPNEIITASGKDANGFYLKQISGQREVSYENDREHKVAIKTGLKFASCKLAKKQITIIVNATAHEIEKNDLSYFDVVSLAFPDFPQHPERTYSVTYEKGNGNKPSGILVPGGSVKPKDKMVFKVKHTGQS